MPAVAAADRTTAALKVVLKGAIAGLDDPDSERLAASVDAIIAGEGVDLGEGATLPRAVYNEACIRLGAYLHQSMPKIGSRLVGEATVTASAIRASGVRALLMPWRSPRVAT